ADSSSRCVVATCHSGVAHMLARLGEAGPALEECEKATALLQEITGEKTGHLERGQAYEALGYAYGALAAMPGATAGEINQRWTSAREMFQECLNVLEDLRRRGALDAASAVWAKSIAGEITKCDAALAK
ncbi:MAG: hypothetical protein ABIR71_06660, partial [Chthoniobacterales bacterium]